MRILHVSATSTVSGANRYAFDLAAGQKDLGHDPIVVMPRFPGTAFDFARSDVERTAFGYPRAFSFLSAMWRAKADIIHCHDGTAARWVQYAPFRPPSIITLHIRYKPRTMAHFDGIHMLADWQIETLASFKGVVKKVNNWTPDIAPASDAVVAETRTAAGAGPEDFLVVFIGRLDHVKGVDLLIDGFKRLSNPRLNLAIVGVGLQEAEIRALAAGDDRIRFMGYSNTPAAWYGAADLVAMPSRREPFALVALEAMACRAPIIVSNVDGFAEMFRDRVDCLLPPENAAAIAEAIATRAAAKTTPAIARDTFDMTRFERKAGVATVTSFYKDVIASTRKG